MDADYSKQRDQEIYTIIRAAMEVYKQLGNGFLEAVYQHALEVEFRQRKIIFSREHNIPVQRAYFRNDISR